MKYQPTPVFWPGKFHGQRRLEGYSPKWCKIKKKKKKHLNEKEPLSTIYPLSSVNTESKDKRKRIQTQSQKRLGECFLKFEPASVLLLKGSGKKRTWKTVNFFFWSYILPPPWFSSSIRLKFSISNFFFGYFVKFWQVRVEGKKMS